MGYVDDAFLERVPKPSTLLLLGLVGLRRKE
jgi:hypothetical protein